MTEFRPKTPASATFRGFQLTSEMIAGKQYPTEVVPYIRALSTVTETVVFDTAIILLDGEGDPMLLVAGDYIVAEDSGLFTGLRKADFESEFEQVPA